MELNWKQENEIQYNGEIMMSSSTLPQSSNQKNMWRINRLSEWNVCELFSFKYPFLLFRSLALFQSGACVNVVDVRALSIDISTIVFVPVSLVFVCVGACDFIFVMMKLAHAPPRILPPESWQCYYYQSVLELISSVKLVHEPHIAWKRTVFVCTRRTKLGKPHRTANQVYTHTNPV